MFFKQTLSYKLVTLLEELEIKHKYINIFIYWIQLLKFDLSNKRKINKSDNKIELLFTLFKERFYLEHLRDKYNIGSDSKLVYNIINNIIVCEISYGVNINIHIECGILDDEFSIYVLNQSDHKGVNLTKDNLKLEMYHGICINTLHMMHNETCLILGNLISDAIEKMRKVKKDV